MRFGLIPIPGSNPGASAPQPNSTRRSRRRDVHAAPAAGPERAGPRGPGRPAEGGGSARGWLPRCGRIDTHGSDSPGACRDFGQEFRRGSSPDVNAHLEWVRVQQRAPDHGVSMPFAQLDPLDRSVRAHRFEAPLAPAARRVLVVDDHRAFAEMLSLALQAGGMEVVGTAHSAAEAVSLAEETQPDVVVLDIQMPGREDGLSAARRLCQVAPAAVVAVLTAHSDPKLMLIATQAGASAFTPKGCLLAERIDV